MGSLQIRFKEDLKQKLEEHGGKVHAKINKENSYLIACGVAQGSDPVIKKARKLNLPIVREDFLCECIENMSGMVTVKVKGRSAVHEASGLQDSGHILNDGKSIFCTTLNMSDLSTGINRTILAARNLQLSELS